MTESEQILDRARKEKRELLIQFHDFCVSTVDLSNKDETTEQRVDRFLSLEPKQEKDDKS